MKYFWIYNLLEQQEETEVDTLPEYLKGRKLILGRLAMFQIKCVKNVQSRQEFDSFLRQTVLRVLCVPEYTGLRQIDTWDMTLVQCNGSLLALSVSGIRFIGLWTACWMNSGRHPGENHKETWVIRVSSPNFIFLWLQSELGRQIYFPPHPSVSYH